MTTVTDIAVADVRFVKDLYPALVDTHWDYHYFDNGKRVVWEVRPYPPMGWSVSMYNLTDRTGSHVHGGLHASAVIETLREWGLPADADWTARRSAAAVEPQSRVYLIGAESGGGLVKIGRSYWVAKRLEDIQRMSPVRLAVLWSTPGDGEMETRLHRAFAARRSHGEWFDFGFDDPIETVRKEIAQW